MVQLIERFLFLKLFVIGYFVLMAIIAKFLPGSLDTNMFKFIVAYILFAAVKDIVCIENSFYKEGGFLRALTFNATMIFLLLLVASKIS